MLFDSMNSMNDKMMALVNGVMVGIVTDNKDPDTQGRVKLKLPVHDEQTTTDWVRVATMMAGKGRGTLFVPEVGDEVLVAFHLGDIREPYVIGSLWNKQHTPPPGKDDKNNVRKIQSRGGHELIFGDDDSDGKITLKTKDGHKLEIEDKKDTIVLQDKDSQNSLTINGSSGEVFVKTMGGKISINKTGDVVIESNKSIKIKSAQIQVEATATLGLKGGATVDIKSDGIVNIKGTMVKIN